MVNTSGYISQIKRRMNNDNPADNPVSRWLRIILPGKASDQDFKVYGRHTRSIVIRGTRYIWIFLYLNRINIS